MKKNYIILAGALLLGVVACKPKEKDSTAAAGEIDASSYVAIGGATTAGLMNDALSDVGQENSLGAIIAAKLKLVGGGAFNQPMMPTGSVGCNVYGQSALMLGYSTDCLGATSLGPVRSASQGDYAGLVTNVYNASAPFNNFGIPHMKTAYYVVPGYGNSANGAGNYNPYFARMASDPSTASVMSDILASNPTFFTLFTGLDEVLDYARLGAASGSLTPANGSVGAGFDGSLGYLLTSLSGTGAKGVVSNIPDVIDFPFFNTIPYNALKLDSASAAALNFAYNQIGITFHVGYNAFIIQDASATYGMRQMLPGERVLMSIPLDSVKCHQMGSVNPIPDKYILTSSEINEIQTAITAYNTILENQATQFNFAFVDAYSLYKKLKTGVIYNGIGMNTTFVSGGAFSLDGSTLNARGNALLANEFIKAMNSKYNAAVPQADVTMYNGVKFP